MSFWMTLGRIVCRASLTSDVSGESTNSKQLKKHRDKAVYSRFPEICQRILVRILVNENLSADFEFFFHGDCPAVEGLSVRGKHVVVAIMIRWAHARRSCPAWFVRVWRCRCRLSNPG